MYTQNTVKEIKYKVINHYTSSSHLEKTKTPAQRKTSDK